MFKFSKKLNIRFISIFIMVSMVIPALFINYYTGSIGKYIGSSLYMIVAIWGIFEIIKAFGFNKYNSLITSSTIILFFLIGWNEYNLIVHYNLDSLEWKKVGLQTLILKAFDWKPYTLVLLTSLIPIVLEPNIAKNNQLGYIKTQLLITSMMIITFTFFKGAWVINVFSINYLILFVLIAIISDSMAFFGGRFYGLKWFKELKFAPNISPNKTWEGFIIGFVCSFIYIFLIGIFTNIWKDLEINKYLISFLMALFLSFVAPIGDLFFSYLKRQIKIKDFSSLIPGHGGIFDRLDSISMIISTIVLILVFIH